jgi:hypothetical protein
MHADAMLEAASTVADRNDDHVPPEESLAPDEPPTVAWLPALGMGLLLVGILGWVATRSGSTATPVAASAAAAVARPPPAPIRDPLARPVGSGQAPLQRPEPHQPVPGGCGQP